MATTVEIVGKLDAVRLSHRGLRRRRLGPNAETAIQDQQIMHRFFRLGYQ